MASSSAVSASARETVEKPSKKSSIVSPPSKYSNRVWTGTRVPRNTGTPCIVSGSFVIAIVTSSLSLKRECGAPSLNPPANLTANTHCIAAVDQGSFIETHPELASIDCIPYRFIVCLRWMVGAGSTGKNVNSNSPACLTFRSPCIPTRPFKRASVLGSVAVIARCCGAQFRAFRSPSVKGRSSLIQAAHPDWTGRHLQIGGVARKEVTPVRAKGDSTAKVRNVSKVGSHALPPQNLWPSDDDQHVP